MDPFDRIRAHLTGITSYAEDWELESSKDGTAFNDLRALFSNPTNDSMIGQMIQKIYLYEEGALDVLNLLEEFYINRLQSEIENSKKSKKPLTEKDIDKLLLDYLQQQQEAGKAENDASAWIAMLDDMATTASEIIDGYPEELRKAFESLSEAARVIYSRENQTEK